MDTEYIITDDAFAEDRDTFEIEQDAPKKSSRKRWLLVLAVFSIFILLLLAFGASQISGKYEDLWGVLFWISLLMFV